MDIVIVLGSRLTGKVVHDELRGRLDSALDTVDSDRVFIVSGGITNIHVGISEAEAMASYLVDKGIPEERIIKEERSTDTIENGYYTRLIVEGMPSFETIYVVSSCYHMPRVKFIFDNCFGKPNKLDFSHCSQFKRIGEKETEGMLIAEKFFKGIEPGNEAMISDRLEILHKKN